MTPGGGPSRPPAPAVRWREPERLAARQHGVITRAQAAASGLTPRMIEYAIRPGGRWRRLLPGVYLAGDGEPGRDQLLMAAQLYAGDDAVITGLAALRWHGLPVPPAAAIDVLVPYARRRVSSSLIRVHRTTRMPVRAVAAGPVRYAPPARAIADAARGPQPPDARALAAGAIARGLCTLAEIADELAGGPRRHTARLRAALAELGAAGAAPE